MKLVESEKANPQDYFLQSDVDEQGNPIYDLLNEEVTDYSPARAFRKKVFDGNADVVVLADTIQIYWKGNLIAEAQLEGQVETSPGVWQGQLFSFADANISKITEVPGTDHEGNPIMVPVTPFFRAYVVKDIPILGITDAVFGLDVHWAFKDTKLSFYLDAPGFNARIRWQCRVKDTAVYVPPVLDENGNIVTPAQKGLQFSVSDYEGEVNHGSQADPEAGWTQHWWTFEPSGKLCDMADARTPLERYEQGVGLVVDPYLSVDEQSTYIDVLCDGYLMSFPIDNTNGNIMSLYNPAKSNIFYNSSFFVYDDSLSYYYHLGFDPNTITQIVENTPNRVKVRVKGKLDRTSGASSNYLTNLDYVELVFTIYPDRYVLDSIWEVSGSISLDTGDFAVIDVCSSVLANLTAENNVYENSGSESDCSDYTAYNSADYLAVLADEVNIQFIVLIYANWSFNQWNNYDGDFGMLQGVGTLAANTYTMKVVHIIDSASRQGSAKLYDSTDRLAMGNQYKDLEIDLTQGGSRVFDDASEQYLKINDSVSVTEPLTISGWIKTDANQDQGILYVGQEDATDFHKIIVKYATNLYAQATSSHASSTYARSTTTLSLNTWHNIVGVFVSDSERSVYLDGGGKDTDTGSVILDPPVAMTIGRSQELTPGDYVSGKIAHVAVWNVALTDAEVARLAAGALPTEIRPEALVAYWPLIDDDNDIIGGYNMTPYNSPTWSTTDYPNVYKPDLGKWEIQDILPAVIEQSGFQSDGAWHILPKVEIAEGSRVFDDGSTQYLQWQGTPPVSAKPITMAVWFKSDDAVHDNEIFSITDKDAAANHFRLLAADDGKLYWQVKYGGSTANTITTASWSANQWQHACGILSDAGRYVYLNGANKISGGTVSFPSNLDNIAIGGFIETTPGYMSGKIAHAAIWNVALTDAEVAVLARGVDPRCIRPNNLVAYWPLTDDDNDLIGSYDMTPYNSPTWSTSDYPNVRFIDSNYPAKLTLDRTRIRPAFTIHDWPFQYGPVASPTSILLNHLKMDDNAASSVLTAEVGPNGTWRLISDGSARNTNNDSVATDNFRGRALDTAGGTNFAEMEDGAVHTNAFFLKGSILIKFTPQFIYTGGGDIVTCLIGGSDYISFWYASSSLQFNCKWGGTSGTDLALAFTANYSLQRPMTALLFWDSDKDFYGFAIDGKVIATTILTAVPATSSIYQFYIGCWQDRASPSDIIIDEIKTFSECVLPFGAFFIGNGQGLLADIDNPHADLTWFFDGQAAAAKGGSNLASDKNPTNSGGSFVTTDPLIGTNHWDANGASNVLTVAESSEDIVDYNNGFVAGWFNVQTITNGTYLIDVRDGDGSDRISAVVVTGGYINVTYRSNSTDEAITGNIAITAGKWFFLRITWDDNGGDKKVHSYINGVENGTPQTIANVWGGGNGLTWYFTEDYAGANGCDAFIQTLWMGKKANVPQIWTAFGKPLHTPRIDLT